MGLLLLFKFCLQEVGSSVAVNEYYDDIKSIKVTIPPFNGTTTERFTVDILACLSAGNVYSYSLFKN